jgi:replicative DNA helicase
LILTDALADTEAEQALVGAAFHDNAMVMNQALIGDEFMDPLLGSLWDLARSSVERGGVFSVALILQKRPDLQEFLIPLADFGAIGIRNVSSYVTRIKDFAARRRLKLAAEELIDRVQNPEFLPEEAGAALIGEIASISLRDKTRDKRAVAENVYHLLSKPTECYSTGLPTLDDVLGGGFFSGKLYGVSARKKVGKTVMLGTISHNMNKRGIKHLFVCAEMSDVEIEQRNMAREFGINSLQFLGSKRVFLKDRVAKYAADIPANTVYEHIPGIGFDDLRRAVSAAVVRHKIKGVVLDYWQLVGGKAKSETEEYHLRIVAQYLADICRKENLWCLVAAQVNQDGNTRGGEGLKLACDVYFTLHREKDQEGAWLEMEESRYVLYANVGSEDQPGLWLNKHGPFFEEPERYDPQTGEVA